MPTTRRILLLAGAIALSTDRLTAQTLSAILEMRIDGNAADLSPISRMIVMKNGVIVVDQPQDGLLRFFEPTGKLLGTFGRRGEGPGEFRSLAVLGFIGDSLWVYDRPSDRITIVSGQLKLVSTIPIPKELTAGSKNTRPVPPITFTYPVGLYPSGDLLMHGRSQSQAALESSPWKTVLSPGLTPVIRTTRAGGFQALLSQISMQSPACQYKPRAVAITIPECPGPYNQVSADGHRMASLVPMTTTPSGPSAKYQLTITSMDGSGVTTHIVNVSNHPISQRSRDSIRAFEIDRLTQPRVSEGNIPAPPVDPEIISAFRSVPIPQVLNPVVYMKLGNDGTVWLRLRASGGKRQWQQIGLDGTTLGFLTLPVNSIIYEGNRTHIWTIETDQDEMQTITRYRISKP